MSIRPNIFPDKIKAIHSRDHEPDVYSLTNEDEGMNDAIEKARLTLHYFVDCLKAPRPGQLYFSVKVNIADAEHSEHLWLITLEFDNEENLFGVVANAPLHLTNILLDQRIGIEKDKITDWMIIENQRLIGGYTLRAIRHSIEDEEELARFDESTLKGVFIDEGEDYFLANFDTPEGAILCLEKAYDECDVDSAIYCKDFFQEARMMLQQEGMLDKFVGKQRDEMIRITAEAIECNFIKYFQDNGFPDFSNLKRAFPKRDKISHTHWVISEVLYFPDYTKSLQMINTCLTLDGWRVC